MLLYVFVGCKWSLFITPNTILTQQGAAHSAGCFFLGLFMSFEVAKTIVIRPFVHRGLLSIYLNTDS